MKYLKIFTNNWQVKLLAVVVALGLWIYAASVKVSVSTFPSEIPVKALNLTPGLVAIFDQNSVKINISADSTIWNKLSTDSFAAFIDLNGYKVGSYQIPISVTTSVPGVAIISRNPTTATVTIEPSVSKDLPVVAKISGQAAQNMIVSSVIFNPSTVSVTGPKSEVDGITQSTASIVLSGESADFSKSVTLSALDQKGDVMKNVYFAPTSVSADVKIVAAGNVKTLGVLVATNGSPMTGFAVSTITTNPATVSVSGAAGTIQTLSSISTMPVNLNNQNKTFTTNANLVFPLGVQSAGPTSVSVTVIISSQTITTTLSIPIKTSNLPAGLSIGSISPQSVSTTFSGSVAAINSLTADQIALLIDLSSAIMGSHQYQIAAANFSLPAGVNLVNFTSSTVTISIQ